MCDVVFITPNIDGKLPNASIGTLQLASVLKENHISCEILPFFLFGDIRDFSSFLTNALNAIEERSPRILSFYTRCDCYHIMLRIAEQIKARRQDIYIVLGGPQSDITCTETVAQVPFVDYVCCGEGEETIYPLFSSLLNGTPDLSVPGLVYRQDGQVIKNPKPEMIADLDSLPLLDYSLAKIKAKLDRNRTFTIDVGRGCPFGCTFCSTKSFWGRKYRLKSPQRIYLEMKDLHEKYGTTAFIFAHDMFTLNRQKVTETCRLIKSLDFKARWTCSARLDCIDPELIDIMADCGMYSLYMGIETGSPRMQKLINKNLNLDRALEVVGYLSSKNIQCTASFIYGFPEETEADLSQTMALMAKLLNLKNVEVQAHLCAFLVGTELTERYKDQLVPMDVYSDATGTLGVAECQDLIGKYPELFRQMMEYKTPLRAKLEYFSVFWDVWQQMEPVYHYIFQHYPEDQLIRMYYDFADDNRQLLESLEHIPQEQRITKLLREDTFFLRFSEDENFDILSDLYRMKRAAISDEVQNGGSNTDVYCIAPSCVKEYRSIRQYPRCLAMVTYTKDKCKSQVFPLE